MAAQPICQLYGALIMHELNCQRETFMVFCYIDFTVYFKHCRNNKAPKQKEHTNRRTNRHKLCSLIVKKVYIYSYAYMYMLRPLVVLKCIKIRTIDLISDDNKRTHIELQAENRLFLPHSRNHAHYFPHNMLAVSGVDQGDASTLRPRRRWLFFSLSYVIAYVKNIPKQSRLKR